MRCNIPERLPHHEFGTIILSAGGFEQVAKQQRNSIHTGASPLVKPCWNPVVVAIETTLNALCATRRRTDKPVAQEMATPARRAQGGYVGARLARPAW
jgi:hypothetical protein